MATFPLEDYLLIAGAVLSLEAEQVLAVVRVGEAESALAAPFATFGGEVFYPDPVQRAGVLASRIVRNHALPDGNKRTALICMLELLERGYILIASQDERAEAIEQLASQELTEPAFIRWLEGHVARSDSDAAT